MKIMRRQWLPGAEEAKSAGEGRIAPLTEEETETKKEIDKNIYQETDPPLRSLPKALVAEMDFNERRERAIEKLRNYIA